MASTQAFPPKGRQDTIFNEVTSVIRVPAFVDNTVLHAEYTRERSNTKGTILKVTPPLGTDFQYAHDRTYSLIEEQDGLRLTHPTRDGSRYTGAIYFDGNKLSSSSSAPPLLLFAEEESTEQRLRPKEVHTATYGSRLTLQNMRGRTLEGIEFTEKTVRLGQTVDIGLRTTDLIQQLFIGVPHSLNSVDIGLSFTGPRGGATSTNYKGADLVRHSTRFLSANFQGVNLISALRFVGRHDGHTMFYDRFGNLLYAPSVFLLTDRTLGETTGVNSVQSEPLVGLANRLKILGKQRANNDDIVVVVDDGELQKKQGSIKTMEILDPVVRTETAARRVAGEYLRMNRKAQNVLRSKGHINSWDIGPGDVVHYKAPSTGSQRYVAVLEATHSLRDHTTDLDFTTFETGIERMLTGFTGRGELQNDLTEPDLTQQIRTLQNSNTGSIGLFVIPSVSTFTLVGALARNHSDDIKTVNNATPDKHAGFIIGHRYSQGNITSAIGTTDMTKAARGAIGVGASLSTKIAGSGSAQYIHATKLLTVASTDGFPATGTIMIVAQDDSLAYSAAYDAITSTTFHIVTSFGADKTWTNDARVIYARPRSHETRVCRSRRKVLTK